MAKPTTVSRGYGEDHRALRDRWVALLAQGQTVPCACEHRGCPHHAGPCLTVITADTPWDLGHTEDRRDWTGPECVPCNRSAGARASNGQPGLVTVTRRAWCAPHAPQSGAGPRPAGAGRVVIVVGPPCSGKTTWVEQAHGPGDVVVDYDAIAVALGSPTGHDHGRGMIEQVEAARRAMVDDWLARSQASDRAWVILTRARQFDLIPRANIARIVLMPTPLKECERRAARAGRDELVMRVIRSYASEYVQLEIASADIGIDLESPAF